MEFTKEFIQNLMRIKGEMRGVVFKTDAEFILREKGREGLKKVEEELEKLGYPIKYDEIKTFDFFPIGFRMLSMLVIKQTFNFDDQKIKEMGTKAPRLSLIIRFFLQYFVSLKRLAEQAPKMWREHCNVGDLKTVDLNEEKGYVIVSLENFHLHPLYCTYLAGYLQTILEWVVKAPVDCQETQCYFRGEKNHQFLLKWR